MQMFSKVAVTAGLVALVAADSPAAYGSSPAAPSAYSPSTTSSSSSEISPAPYKSSIPASSPVSPVSTSSPPPAYTTTSTSSSSIISSPISAYSPATSSSSSSTDTCTDEITTSWSSSSTPVSPTSTSTSTSSLSSCAPPSNFTPPSCWDQCFASNHITSEASLCGNSAVTDCVQSSCSVGLAAQYTVWLQQYCESCGTPVTSSSSSVVSSPTGYVPSSSPVSPVTTSTTSSSSTTTCAPASSFSPPACWDQCFGENQVSSEGSLCGNAAVTSCIQSTCDSADSTQYTSWLAEYCSGSGCGAQTTSVIGYTSTTSTVWGAESSPAQQTWTVQSTTTSTSTVTLSPTGSWPSSYDPAWPASPACTPGYTVTESIIEYITVSVGSGPSGPWTTTESPSTSTVVGPYQTSPSGNAPPPYQSGPGGYYPTGGAPGYPSGYAPSSSGFVTSARPYSTGTGPAPYSPITSSTSSSPAGPVGYVPATSSSSSSAAPAPTAYQL